MEGKAHRSYKSSVPGQMSRMEQDLSASPHIPGTCANGLSTGVTRRVIPKGDIPHICIVGAGISGLRCAEVLIQNGFKVTILEGRDRIGGRVHQSNYLGHLVDLGPNWIHGSDNNPILDLAHETNTTIFSPDQESSMIFDESGHLLNHDKGKEISRLVWGILDAAFKHSNENSASIPPDRSLMDFFETKVKEKQLDESTSKQVFQMAHVWGDYVGEPIETQSLKYMWLEECIDDENLFVASTYSAILDRVAQTALAKAEIQLSTKAKSFHYNPAPNEENPLVSITTSSPSNIIAQSFDEVVITTPLGWLKRNLTSFFPRLPSRLTTAIINTSYGRLEKVYLTFPTAFWFKATGNPPFFTQFLSPTYVPLLNPHRWTLEPLSLASLPLPTAHPTLLFYLNGPSSSHVTSLVSSLSVDSPEYHSLLSEFFRPYYSLLPNYDSASPACQPSKILSTDWQHDEFAGWGSYTNFQVSPAEKGRVDKKAMENTKSILYINKDQKDDHGQGERDDEVHLDKDIEALRQGCPERGMWFAGEHTAPFVALGTVTGAYWSGEAVARRIMAAYGNGGGEEDE